MFRALWGRIILFLPPEVIYWGEPVWAPPPLAWLALQTDLIWPLLPCLWPVIPTFRFLSLTQTQAPLSLLSCTDKVSCGIGTDISVLHTHSLTTVAYSCMLEASRFFSISWGFCFVLLCCVLFCFLKGEYPSEFIPFIIQFCVLWQIFTTLPRNLLDFRP